jgi:hypothetical protein
MKSVLPRQYRDGSLYQYNAANTDKYQVPSPHFVNDETTHNGKYQAVFLRQYRSC